MEGRYPPVVKKVLRSPTVKRKSKVVPITEKVTLEKVLGLTVSSSAALASDPKTGTIAYPAGCVVVLYNPKLKRQQFVMNSSKKTITCVAFSGDGKHLVTGESGHQPCVRVYEQEDNHWMPIAEFSGHKFGISVVAFSPNLKHIISIGTQHDMTVYVWNWRTKAQVASNKVAAKVTDISFSKDGSYFVTVGNRHVKFWYLDASKSKRNETVPLMGRSGLLGEQKNNFFCGVACGIGQLTGTTFVITRSGLLCQFNSKRLLEKWVELRTSSANCVMVTDQHIFIGCADGIVRIFSPFTLQYVTSLPRPHYLGVDVSTATNPVHSVPSGGTSSVKYPDTIAISVDPTSYRLTCVYNDHSLYIWDITDVHHIGKSKSMLAHSACIWGLEVYPNLEKGALPNGSFVTCSEDDTIRIWNVDQNLGSDTTIKRNIYSNDLLKTIYIDPNYTNLLDIEFNPAGKNDKTDNTFQEKSGVRSIKVSPDGKHLASGDRTGNIRVHDLEFMDQVFFLEAHDSEVLSLEFTKPEHGVNLLTSAGRDRLLHVFDCEQDYGLVQTLDDHSAAITAIRFVTSKTESQEAGISLTTLKMITCGADKSILFRNAVKEPEFQFMLNRHLVAKTTLYDMDLDPTGKFVATACQDRNVRVYNIKNGKQKRTYCGAVHNEGTLIRVELDPSGSYVATSCSDKNLCILDFYTGEILATMAGHSEIVTGIKFTNDLRHLISVSGDGCIFIWRLPYEFTVTMQNRYGERVCDSTQPNTEQQDAVDDPGSIAQQKRRVVESDGSSSSSSRGGPPPLPTSPHPAISTMDDNANIPEKDYKSDFRFSIGQLPGWAKKQVSLSGPLSPPTAQPASPSLPKGRWAQTAGEKIVVKSMLDETSIHINLNNLDKKRQESRVSIINDDDVFNKDDEEDDDFRPTRTAAFTCRSPTSSCMTDDEDEEEDNNEVVYYPQTSYSDLSEAGNPLFRVYGGQGGRTSGSGKDALSEAASLSDEEASLSATTPVDEDEQLQDFSAPPTPDIDIDQEKFLKDNFEVLSTGEAFGAKLDSMEEQVSHASHTSRSSLSARFLSRAQQQHLHSVAATANAQLQANSKRKEDIAKPADDNTHSGKKKTSDTGRRRTTGTSNDQPLRPSSTSSSSRRQTMTNASEETPVSTVEMTPEPIKSQKSAEENKKRSTLIKHHSYLQATTSSKAKNSADSGSTTKLTSASTTSVSSGVSKKPSTLRRGRLSAGMKAKYKSSPDLAAPDPDSNVLVPAGSIDDLDIDTKESKKSGPVTRANRRSMLVTSNESKDYNSSSRSSEERDRLAMPPPPLGFVPSDSTAGRKTSAPELTLAQAKEILLGKKEVQQQKETDKKENQGMDRRSRLRNKSPSRQLPSTPLTTNGTTTTTYREKSHSLTSGIMPKRLNHIASPPLERKIPEESLSPTSSASSSPDKQSNHSDSLDETPVKESRDANLHVAGSLSGALSMSPASRPSQLNLHMPREGSPDDVKSASTMSLNRPNRLSRALSPLKSILKGGRKKDKEVEVTNGESVAKEGKRGSLPIDVLGNITWKKAHTQEQTITTITVTTQSPDMAKSRLSKNREMLSKVLGSPPLPSSSPPSTSTGSPRSSLSSVSSDAPQASPSSSSPSPPSQPISSPPSRRSNVTAASPPPTVRSPISSPPTRRWTASPVSPASGDAAAAAADARGKWDLALQQQQQTKRGPSPRRISATSSLTLTVTSAVPATSSPVAVHSVTTENSSSRADHVILPATVKEEDVEVQRYDKSRQSPPISLNTTVSEQVANSAVVLSRPANSIVLATPPALAASRRRCLPTDDEEAVNYAVAEIESMKEFLGQLPELCKRLSKEESIPANFEQLAPGLLSLKRAIEKVPGCEPPPPTVDPEILTDFRSSMMQMMDRLTNQISQTGNGEPPRESTHF